MFPAHSRAVNLWHSSLWPLLLVLPPTAAQETNVASPGSLEAWKGWERGAGVGLLQSLS